MVENISIEGYSPIDYEVKIDNGEFSLWKLKVPKVDIDP
jgi:hypothetical protein